MHRAGGGRAGGVGKLLSRCPAQVCIHNVNCGRGEPGLSGGSVRAPRTLPARPPPPFVLRAAQDTCK